MKQEVCRLVLLEIHVLFVSYSWKLKTKTNRCTHRLQLIISNSRLEQHLITTPGQEVWLNKDELLENKTT